jgi:riboflavin synthase
MFSGIIEERGRVAAVERRQTEATVVIAARLAARLRPGDSVAVNGVCLTAVAADSETFRADVSPTTLQITTLGTLAAGAPVNLEPALRLHDVVGGHLVSGHVDAVGTVRNVVPEGDSRHIDIGFPADARALLTERGSVAVDGISLTVVGVEADGFRVTIIPHTLTATTAATWAPGRSVNLEFDMLAKYVRQLMAPWQAAAPGARP